ASPSSGGWMARSSKPMLQPTSRADKHRGSRYRLEAACALMEFMSAAAVGTCRSKEIVGAVSSGSMKVAALRLDLLSHEHRKPGPPQPLCDQMHDPVLALNLARDPQKRLGTGHHGERVECLLPD